jgi:hypothetical protein
MTRRVQFVGEFSGRPLYILLQNALEYITTQEKLHDIENDESLSKGQKAKAGTARKLADVVCDEHGTLLYPNAGEQLVTELDLSFQETGQLLDTFHAMNGLDKRALEKAEKN